MHSILQLGPPSWNLTRASHSPDPPLRKSFAAAKGISRKCARRRECSNVYGREILPSVKCRRRGHVTFSVPWRVPRANNEVLLLWSSDSFAAAPIDIGPVHRSKRISNGFIPVMTFIERVRFMWAERWSTCSLSRRRCTREWCWSIVVRTIFWCTKMNEK